MNTKYKLAIVGAGGIGQAVGLILAVSDDLDVDIYIGDVNTDAAENAVKWVQEGSSWNCKVTPFTMPMKGTNREMTKVFKACDIVLDCLPGSQAPRIAAMAKKHSMHYANLTEYVKETNEVMEIAKGSKQGFVLQTGLAPGFINVLAHKIYQDFSKEFKVKKVDSISMKVGALTKNAIAPHFYGFTWSPVGVATEYIKDCVAVRNSKKITTLPALSECKTIIIDGITYEDNFTSGGAADLPDFFAGKVKDLDYKTLRYPGHYQWVNNILSIIPEEGDAKVQKLQNTMQAFIPCLEDDVVIIYAAVRGKDKHGILRSKEKTYSIKPSYVGTKKLRAIQSTTAAPLCEIARMLLTGRWQGPILQGQLDTDEFMNGPFVSSIYGSYGEVKKKKNTPVEV